MDVQAVAFAHPGGLLAEVEGRRGFAVRKQAECPITVQGLGGCVATGWLCHATQCLKEPGPVFHAHASQIG